MKMKFLFLPIVAGICLGRPVLAMDEPQEKESHYVNLQQATSHIQKCKQILLSKQFDQDEISKVVTNELSSIKSKVREEYHQINSGKIPLGEEEIETEATKRLLEVYLNLETTLIQLSQGMKTNDEKLSQADQQMAELKDLLTQADTQLKQSKTNLDQTHRQFSSTIRIFNRYLEQLGINNNIDL